MRRPRRPWWRLGIQQSLPSSMIRQSQRCCQYHLIITAILANIMMSSHDENEGSEGWASPKLLQLCLCLAFHTGLKHNLMHRLLSSFLWQPDSDPVTETFANNASVPSWGTSWCAVSPAMYQHFRWLRPLMTQSKKHKHSPNAQKLSLNSIPSLSFLKIWPTHSWRTGIGARKEPRS